VVVREGDVLSLDGTTGAVFLGAVAVTPSPVEQYFEGELAPEDGDDLVQSVHRLVQHADASRRLGVRANADTPEDAERARRYGAGGIGLCRTEHMFLGDRRQLVEDLVLAESEQEQATALAALLPLQREDFLGILRAMDGLPVTVRLLDPPLHEFLPDFVELQVECAVARRPARPSTRAGSGCSRRSAGCTRPTR
jgi:pyruvate,orthophosphate dikinase